MANHEWRKWLTGDEYVEYQRHQVEAKKLQQARKKISQKMIAIRNRCAARRLREIGPLDKIGENHEARG